MANRTAKTPEAAIEKAANQPETLTNADIKTVMADDGTDLPHNTANADAAETLEQNRAEAKGDETERGYFHGHGGAAGI
jgi:hypothetical protein